MHPVVAIVGRPNVGKSSLFNSLIRRRLAIVEPTPGVTRDRLHATVEAGGKAFTVIDTGGVGVVDRPDLAHGVEQQVQDAVTEADLILFLVDIKEGPTPLDDRVAQLLRVSGKPLLLAANKADHDGLDMHAADFYRFGLGEPLPISAEQRRNLPELLEELAASLPEATEGEGPATEPVMRLAVVGRRNAGKSTLVNALAGAPRVLVSEVAGTTRDVIDVEITRGDRRFVVVDTAGVRKRSAIQNSVEFYAQSRAEGSVKRADISLLLLDATVDVGGVDKKIADNIVRHHRGCVIGVNKWDQVPENVTPEAYETYIRKKLPGLHFAPLSFLSSREGWNVEETFALTEDLYQQMHHRIGTADINKAIREAIDRRSPPPKKGKIAKVYFASQVDVNPPTIVLFLNDPALMPANYVRYLGNWFRDRFPFAEVPIRFLLRRRTRTER